MRLAGTISLASVQHVLEQGDAPTRRDRGRERRALVFQIPIPDEGHEDVREQQQDDGGDALEEGRRAAGESSMQCFFRARARS